MSLPQVITLGCRLNHAESARLAAELGDAPGTVLVNTCAVTAEAVRHSRRAVRTARRTGARVIATGCAATIDPKGARLSTPRPRASSAANIASPYG